MAQDAGAKPKLSGKLMQLKARTLACAGLPQQPQPSRLTRPRCLPRFAQFMQRAVEKERVVVAETAQARRVRRAARAAAPPQSAPR
jgi:hypothetical protein